VLLELSNVVIKRCLITTSPPAEMLFSSRFATTETKVFTAAQKGPSGGLRPAWLTTDIAEVTLNLDQEHVGPPSEGASTAGTNRRLAIAGVMVLLPAVLSIIGGIILLIVGNNSSGVLKNDSGWIVLFGVFVFGVGIGLIAIGRGAIRGRPWARTSIIVVATLGTIPRLVTPIFGARSFSPVAIAYGVPLLYLAITGKAKSNERDAHGRRD
jgi:hypothetical protein